jgi:hypothetical protein
MIYAYLFVDNLNGHSYVNGIDELRASVNTLKKNISNNDSIVVFNNETSGKNIDFFKDQKISHYHINLSRKYKGSDNINPISILVEKIICLMNFNENEDIVLMDIDTAIVNQIPNDYWDDNHIVFDNIEYPIMQWRNLDKVLPQIPWKDYDINFDSSFVMYNTGVIYIPKRFRKEVCERALKIVDYLNDNFEPEDRCGNKLDEQIALSIVAHDCFGKYGNIKLSSEYIYHYWEERQNNIKWWESEEFKYKNKFEKLPISIGILSWNSNQTLRNTLNSYKKNGLFDIVDNVVLFFQEISEEDKNLAMEYDIPFISSDENIGIGRALLKLSEVLKEKNILLLEHDWELNEDIETTFLELKQGIELLDSDYDCIRLRSVKNPGHPVYSQNVYPGNELNYYDTSIDLMSPHLFECRHWMHNADEVFADKIKKENNYFTTTSRWGNFTNNPCLYKKNFYTSIIRPFEGKGLLYNGLESNVCHWWARQNFKIAWGKGLFTHNDIEKYRNQF